MKLLKRHEKGQVLLLVALAMFAIMGAVALAVDVGLAYGVKAKLNAAVDAAALAAGRVISAQGSDAAKAEAGRFFRANYPNDLLGSTAPEVHTEVVNSDGAWTITVSATAVAPAYFAKVFNINDFTVGASSTSTLRPIDLILLMDTSSSLNEYFSNKDTFPDLQAAAIRFVGNFDTENDRVGLIHFASGAVVDVPITDARGFDRAVITNVIGNLKPLGRTTAEEGMRSAKAQLDAVSPSSQSRLRVIVFFTDGAPNGVAGNFTNGTKSLEGTICSEIDGGGAPRTLYDITKQEVKLEDLIGISSLPSKDYTGTINLASDISLRPLFSYSNTRCNVNMAARNMLENVANAARSEAVPIHIFTIGLGDGMFTLTNLEKNYCGYGSKELGTNILRRVANVQGVDTYNPKQPTGMYVFAGDSSQLNAAFNAVAGSILRLSK